MDQIRPEQLLDLPLPDLAPAGPDGQPWPLRQYVGRSPFVLFFFTHNCSPGCLQELREFADHHDAFAAAGVPVAGISLDSSESNREFMTKTGLRYPLLSDPERACGRAFGVTQRIGVGGWQVEFYLRASFLVSREGTVAGVWGKFLGKQHAETLLRAAKALQHVASR